MKLLLIPIFCSLPVLAFGGEIYRWVDKNGVTHFSQDPPADAAYKRITPEVSSPPANANAASGAQKAAEKVGGELNKTREAGLKLKAETLERCAKARERITFLEEKTARRLFKTGPDGQPARYTDEEFNAELDKAKKESELTCN